MALCKCGCGAEAPPGKEYLHGHWLKRQTNLNKQEAEVSNLGEETKRPIWGEFGAHGTPIFAGLVSEDYLAKFQSLSSALEIYDQMRRSDATVQSILLVWELPILSTKFFVRPASDSLEDKEAAAYIEWNLFHGMTHTFPEFLRMALGKFWAGFSWFEKVFEEDGPRVKWRKLAVRLQNTLSKWELDETGGPKGAWQQAWRPDEICYTPVYIPIEKLLLFINRKEGGNLQGMSCLRAAYKHWLIKDKLYRLEAISLERDAVGIPVMRLPRRATAAEKAQAKDIVTSLRRDEKAGVTIPDDWNLFLLGGGGGQARGTTRGAGRGGGQANFRATIDHHDLMIAKSMLAQFLNLPGATYGSYALSTDQSTLLLQALNYEADYFCHICSRHAFQQLCHWNWPKLKNYPLLDHHPISPKNIRIAAQAWALLSRAGLMTPSPETEKFVRETLGFPPLEAAIEKDRFSEYNKPEEPDWEEVNFPESNSFEPPEQTLSTDASTAPEQLSFWEPEEVYDLGEEE